MLGISIKEMEPTLRKRINREPVDYIAVRKMQLLEDRDKAYDWERFHQERHREKFGELPRYNKVLAPKKGAILLEDENG